MLNRTITAITLIAIALLANLIVPSAAETKLLAHWNFDQIANNTLKDDAGNNDGVLLGNLQESDIRPGLYGSALYFDSGKRQIKLNNSEAISLANDFTIECIIKPEDVTGYRTILWKGNRQVNPEAINYNFDIRDGKPEMKFKDKDGNWIVYSSSPILEPEHWYQIIFTYKDGNVDIYVNGEKLRAFKSEEGKGQSLLPNKYDAFIGVGATASSPQQFFFTGLIDDIKIYQGRVVNIAANYQSQWQQLLTENKEQTAHFELIQKKHTDAQEEKLQLEYAAMFKSQATTPNAPFAISILPTAKRLVKEPEFFKKLDSFSKVAKISAARNEYEGFNIITLGNPSQDTKIDNVTVSDLVNGDGSRISSKNITCGYVKDVTTKKPSISVDFVGAIPDIIMNGVTNFKVAKDSFTPIFVKVYTGDAKAGEYKGTVTLTSNGYSEKVPVKLRVYDFALPEKGSLRTAFSFFEDYYKQWYGLKEISFAQKKYFYDFLLSYRLSPNNIYSSELIHPDLKSLEEMKDRTNFFTIQRYGNSKPVSEETLSEQVKAVGDVIARIKQAGLQDDMYYYSYDEVMGHFTESKLAAVTQINTALRKTFPALRMMQTSFPDPRIEDLFNVWAPQFQDFDSKEKLTILERLRKRGDEIWWYSADEPTTPYPNFFLDYPVYDNRIISTLSYMYHIDGILYWSINREWLTNMDISKQGPNAQWKPYIFSANTGVKKARNGMGNFVYPGPNGQLLPSIRLENLRDGLEDYEYLKELEKGVVQLQKANIKDKGSMLKEAEGLLKVPNTVAISVSKWSTDPKPLLDYRNQVGVTITQINEILNKKGN